VVRTDGTYRFSRSPDDFPELDSGHDAFTTVAAAKNAIAWVGSNRGLLRLDASTGSHHFYSPSNSAIPGENVAPMAVSPDGVVWFTNFQSTQGTEWGLCWFDGTSFGIFPAPKDGGPQWGGLPHAQINDIEVRVIPGGYELWVSCPEQGHRGPHGSLRHGAWRTKNAALTLGRVAPIRLSSSRSQRRSGSTDMSFQSRQL
jgi:hypothetical protein